MYRLKRFRPAVSTARICLAAAIALTILAIAGEEKQPSPTYGTSPHQFGPTQFRHGWPWPFLWRTIREDVDDASEWEITSGEPNIAPLALAYDMGAISTLVALVGLSWSYWKKSRRLTQFGVRGCLIAIFIVSAVFAWWRYERTQEFRERQLADKAGNSSDLVFLSRPGWLWRWVPYSWYSRVEEVIPQRADSLTIHHLESEQIDRLSVLTRLTICDIWAETIKEQSDAKRVFPEIGKIKTLERIMILDKAFSDDDLLALRALPVLNRLEIAFDSRLTDAGIRLLASFPQLRDVVLGPCDVTWAGILELQRSRPDMRIDLQWDSRQ
jgi:hypothetical protein